MSRLRIFATLAIGLWVAAAFQQGASSHLAVFGAKPDFLLVLLCTGGLFVKRVGGATLGFFAAVFYCAIALANLQHYVVSRALTGFAVGWTNDTGVRLGPTIAVVATVVGTMLAQFLLVFMPPPRELPAPLTDTILSALYNGVLAMPAYALLSKAIGSKPS